MAKAASKLKKTAMKSKSSTSGRAKAAPARKALKKSAAKPVAKAANKAAKAANKAQSKPLKKAAPATSTETVKAGKWVYTFGDGKAEGKAGLKDLLGGKE